MSIIGRYRRDTMIFSIFTGFVSLILFRLASMYTSFGETEHGILILAWALTFIFFVAALVGIVECLRPGTFPLRETLFGHYTKQMTQQHVKVHRDSQ